MEQRKYEQVKYDKAVCETEQAKYNETICEIEQTRYDAVGL